MSVRAEVNTAAHGDALVVPIQSVVERPPLAPAGAAADGDAQADDAADDDAEEVQVVFVVADGEARQRPVETGLSDETHVEIVSGLEAGEAVVSGPYRTLRDLDDGDAVRVEENEKRRRRGGGDDEEAEADGGEAED
jgi:HlyD family secretion protein